eukprot:gnl/MRDRNA2_/MRDRNA2_138622_c0_seq1.p1 gnl/MRDRNA2_/MRDRNA2_138622_c0~~gnl/MRDRNA2_/MRDRNA2_138622_c0_seq1.p1  ORF type:complete len:573 (+),score=85.61 gnl/MRDRNA2_/MRDRNA2_138622_c0_seq1:55-1773(+)
MSILGGARMRPEAEVNLHFHAPKDAWGPGRIGKFSRQRRWFAPQQQPLPVAAKRRRPQSLDSAALATSREVFMSKPQSADHTQSKKVQSSLTKLLDLELTSSSLPDMSHCTTPPAWSPPCSLSDASPVEVLTLPRESPPIPSPVSSPSTAPASSVATVLNQLLPLCESPRKGTKSPRGVSKWRQVSKQVSSSAMFMNGLSESRSASKNSERAASKDGPLMSLTELRRVMLRKYDNPQKAFSALERHLDNRTTSKTRGNSAANGNQLRKQLSLAEFIHAISFFGVRPQQARHFFQLMDANNDGNLTLGEFRKALLDMPRDVLLQDFRQRLLNKYPSISDAFKELGGRDALGQRPLDRTAFALKLLSWGVAEEEAQALFNLIDHDQSGSISMEELRGALREVAPWTSLDEFHRRFACEWPDIAQFAGKGANAHRQGTEKLFALLSPAHLSTDLGVMKELPDSLSREAFAEMCNLLDITESNSAELFGVCASSAKWQCRRPGGDVDESVVLLDDFFDCLHLWSENPVNRSVAQLTEKEHRRGSANDIAKHLAPVRGMLKALKGQLASFKPRKELV